MRARWLTAVEGSSQGKVLSALCRQSKLSGFSNVEGKEDKLENKNYLLTQR